MVKKLLTCASTHQGLKPIQVMFYLTLIDLQPLFIFKYQVDKDKYVNFLIPINQTNLFNIGLPVKRSIKVLG